MTEWAHAIDSESVNNEDDGNRFCEHRLDWLGCVNAEPVSSLEGLDLDGLGNFRGSKLTACSGTSPWCSLPLRARILESFFLEQV